MKGLMLVLVVIFTFGICASGFAPDKETAPKEEKKLEPIVQFGLAISIGFSIAMAAVAGAFGQSRAIVATVESIARQPEASGKIFAPFIIGLALIESLVLYVLIVSILLLFLKFTI